MSNIFIILVSIIFVFLITIFRAFLLKKRKDKLNNALNANYFLETINKLIDENKYNLLEERIRLKITDAYGNEDLKKWIGNPPLDEKLIEKSINNGSKRFKEGMSWRNYGFYGWHIDHIKPVSKFNLLDQKQQKKCFNYKNLQPLWAKENFLKSNK